MAKAINWPTKYRDEILNERVEKLCCAVRLGRLYYDNQFWVPGEEVDIRCNSFVVRRGIVQDELKLCTIAEIAPSDYQQLKSGLEDQASLIQYLSQTYNQGVGPDTEVTLVYYKNLPVDPERIEEPN